MINNTNVENKYTTNGSLATVYPITFQGATSTSGVPHLNITLKTADGTSERQLVYNVDYELVREEIDPSVPQTESMSVPPVIGIKLLNAEDATSGNSLTITRETPFVQHIDYQVGRIDPEQVERAADLDVLRDQEIVHRMEEISDVADEALETATEGVELATAAQEDIDGHEADLNNPHQTSLAKLTDTEITSLVAGQFIMFDGLKWKNVYSSTTASWGTILGDITDQTDLNNTFVHNSGDTLSGMYKHNYGSRVRFMANNSTVNYTDLFMNGSEFEIMFHTSNSVRDSLYGRATNGSVTLYPGTDNQAWLGLGSRRWERIFVGKICSGTNGTYTLTMPEKSGVIATKAEVDLAANSGDQITSKGVWYAKMYAATVAPSAENGTNYADFSQVDGQGNPIIVIYNRVNGAWVQDQTITPPADYNGYVTITSKIWDIVEQAGQQGGKVLWSHNQKTFTPYPTIVSFENAALTGTSTAPTPTSASPNTQVANKEYVDNATANSGSGRNIGDTFMTKRTDTSLAGAVECDGATYNTTDFTGDGSIGELLEAGKLDYISLSAYSTAISTKGWCDKIGWDGTGNTQFRVPTLNAHIVQTNNIPVVGNGMTLGLTDGTDTAGINSYANSTGLDPWTGLYGTSVGTASSGSRVTANKSMGITTDPTKSGIIADTSDTAQLRVMIQLATGATDQALETCTSVLADVATLKGYDYVVESQLPTAANNYTWYRKYKSGWVEQGGLNHTISLNSNGYNNMIDLPITMADTRYAATAILSASYGNRTIGHNPNNSTTTQVCIGAYASQAGTSAVNWQVSGMAAS